MKEQKQFKFVYNNYERIDKIYSLLKHLIKHYPDFKEWFYSNYSNISSDRTLISVLNENNEIIGVSLLKENESESKICSFYLLEKYRKLGLGTVLMNHSIKSFKKNNDIILTTSETNIKSSLGGFLQKSNFIIFDIQDSIYLKGQKELYFKYNKRAI